MAKIPPHLGKRPRHASMAPTRQKANVDMKILVTGGAGFIGSALVRRLLASEAFQVVNVDALTYAACPDAVIHAAAESHVGRSHWWSGRVYQEARSRFLQVSANEVFGVQAEGQAATIDGAGYTTQIPSMPRQRPMVRDMCHW